MGWDESLFGFVYKKAGDIRQRLVARGPQDADAPHVPSSPNGSNGSLNDWVPRLSLLASMLAEQPIEVKAMPPLARQSRLQRDEGGCRGTILMIPSERFAGGDDALEYQALVWRVVFGVTSRSLRATLPEYALSFRDARSAKILLSLLAVAPIESAVLSAYPALQSTARALYEAHLVQRIERTQGGLFRKMAPRHLALEVVLRDQLVRLAPQVDGPNVLGGLELTSDVQRFVEQARATQVLKTPSSNHGSFAWQDAQPLCEALQELATTRSSRGPVLWLWGALQPGAIAPEKLGLVQEDANAERQSVERGATEKQGKSQEEVNVIELGDDHEAENPLTHSFEKVHTAEEYKGGRKNIDADDDMDEHSDALDELDIREVIRSKKKAKSIYRADVMLQGVRYRDTDAAPSFNGVAYDEWDAQQKKYLPKFCRVTVQTPEGAEASKVSAWVGEARTKHASQIRTLKAAFDEIEHSRAWRKRQIDGPDVDIDAAIDRYATLSSGHSPSERLYMSRRRSGREVAMLVLLDVSLSTDAWVGGYRVMDVVKESMIVLGEALQHFEPNVALAGFHSHTHRDCSYLIVKAFGEPWSAGYARLASLEPTGYTRMGPAIRHATRALSQSGRAKKLLLLISDGKPTDYDRYEGQYGMQDVRQSLREAEQAGVLPFALAVDHTAKNYLPVMFGQGKYEILPTANQLSRALGDVYGRLLKTH